MKSNSGRTRCQSEAKIQGFSVFVREFHTAVVSL